jgi:hypothetical protein
VCFALARSLSTGRAAILSVCCVCGGSPFPLLGLGWRPHFLFCQDGGMGLTEGGGIRRVSLWRCSICFDSPGCRGIK